MKQTMKSEVKFTNMPSKETITQEAFIINDKELKANGKPMHFDCIIGCVDDLEKLLNEIGL